MIENYQTGHQNIAQVSSYFWDFLENLYWENNGDIDWISRDDCDRRSASDSVESAIFKKS